MFGPSDTVYIRMVLLNSIWGVLASLKIYDLHPKLLFSNCVSMYQFDS